MQWKLLGLALAASVTLLAPAVSAQEREIVTGKVHFADLDLTSAEGQARLDRRIALEADRICASDYRIRLGDPDHEACVKGAIASTRQQVKLAYAQQANSRRNG